MKSIKPAFNIKVSINKDNLSSSNEFLNSELSI